MILNINMFCILIENEIIGKCNETVIIAFKVIKIKNDYIILKRLTSFLIEIRFFY